MAEKRREPDEFINKIAVPTPHKADGKRHQRADINYGTIGMWCAPAPEGIEKLYQKHLAEQQKRAA